MVVILVVLPVVVLVAAAIAALVSVRRSTIRITVAGVEIRNYPQPARLIPLAEVARFEPSVAVGNFSGVRPKTAVLIRTDGSRLPVRSLDEPEAGSGIEALNARVDLLRRQ